jgi:hypothetical protein
MSDKVVSITGAKPASDTEREFVEFFAQRLRGYVELYGHVPDTAVFAVFGNGNDGWDYGTFYMSTVAKARVESCSTAAGLLLRDNNG